MQQGVAERSECGRVLMASRGNLRRQGHDLTDGVLSVATDEAITTLETPGQLSDTDNDFNEGEDVG
eukprot:CAMPEP_0114448240 /NCGR_PEP_ID=MMETSP0103-20121206/20218_1 /TAXON_ID=37642 ORGANISM="Paraphysomonas imperforata, Strain PA2" /NCGR_SAMPLE_ID=MMETSP0103 /ASSEMBLY_ACC=CAM_ASM_000201 /LENGTH=65 /DNA_ID=CAMNT_0001620239 /DNA_START=315 /DNA_END=509 /DNA_ORIENTATION=+